MAFLVGGHSELSTCEGCFPRGLYPEGKQTSQVDNSGCPPTKMAIIVLLTEQRTKSDTYMTTDTKIDNGQKVIQLEIHILYMYV